MGTRGKELKVQGPPISSKVSASTTLLDCKLDAFIKLNSHLYDQLEILHALMERVNGPVERINYQESGAPSDCKMATLSLELGRLENYIDDLKHLISTLQDIL